MKEKIVENSKKYVIRDFEILFHVQQLNNHTDVILGLIFGYFAEIFAAWQPSPRPPLVLLNQ